MDSDKENTDSQPTTPHNKRAITALVLTYNGERLLQQCLQSLQFCDKILVVDSLSTDSTKEIALSLGATVLERPWEGPAAQFQFALSHITTPWVISLDQDEICTPALQAAALAAIEEASSHSDTAGFYVRRSNWYYNRFMRHSGWYPDWLLRVFRPSHLKITVSGAHYSFHPQGNTQKLAADIIHYPYENFRQHLDKINAYAEEGARDLRRKGKKGGICLGLLHGLARFTKLYILQLGVLDGKAGFINAAHGAFYAFLKYLRVQEGTWGAPYTHRK